MSIRGESIYKRKDGRWEARYIRCYENGKAKYRYLYAKTYKDAKEKKLEEQQKISRYSARSSKKSVTFEVLSDLWLSHVKENIKESSYARYCIIVEKHLNTHFKNSHVIKLDLEHFKKFSAHLYAKGAGNEKSLSGKTVADILCVLKAIFKYGKSEGFPCIELSDLKSPLKKSKETMIIPEDALLLMEEKISNDYKQKNILEHEKLGFLLALYTGVRIGELCGIKGEDIDLNAKLLSIKRTVERIKNLDINAKTKTKIVINEPKTHNSFRVIPLPTFLVEHIKNLDIKDNCYLLTGKEKFIEPHQYYVKYKNFMKKQNIDKYTFHALRHTFATKCIEKGFDLKSLSEILGHANVSTTLAIYVHPTLEQKRKQMEMLVPHAGLI